MIHSFQRRLRGLSLAVAGALLAIGSVAHADEASVARLLTQKYPSLSNVTPHAITGTGLYEVTIAGQTAYTDEKVNYLLVGGELLSGSGGKVRNLTRERATAQMNQGAQAAAATARTAAANLNGKGSSAIAAVPAPTVAAAQTPMADASAVSPSSVVLSALTPHNVPNAKASPHGPLKVVQKQSGAYDSLPFDKAIPLVYGNGDRKLAMFADPDCPYCQQMEGTMNARASALNATIYVFLWPLSIHPHSNEKADYLWCEPDRGSAWASWMAFANAMNATQPNADEEDVWKAWIKETHRPATRSCGPSPREEIRGIAEKYGMRVTPTLLFENGAAVSGEVDPAGLEKGWNFVYKGQVTPY